MYKRQEYPYAYELLPSIVKHKHLLAAYAGVSVYNSFAYPLSLIHI